MAHTRVMASAVPGPEEASLMTRRVVGFVWPWAALWLLNQNVPVGDVAGKKTKVCNYVCAQACVRERVGG
jgi:hypothetical protein